MVQLQGGQFACVADVNGEDCSQVLERQRVDLMILGGAPIVRAHILKVPRVGTLNAHQGALPRFRGMNVIEWALLEGMVPTVSVHFVDPGVDTGDIVAMEPIPLQSGDRLSNVRTRSGKIQSELLARMARLAEQGALPRRPQRLEDGRQYYAMHPCLKAVAEQRLQSLLGGTV
jgi:methionyl-tRNA formyltransferase